MTIWAYFICIIRPFGLTLHHLNQNSTNIVILVEKDKVKLTFVPRKTSRTKTNGYGK